MLIAFNTLVNNVANIVQTGRTGGLGATDITIVNNIIQGGGPAASIAGPYIRGSWSGNIIFGTNGAGAMPPEGYRMADPGWPGMGWENFVWPRLFFRLARWGAELLSISA